MKALKIVAVVLGALLVLTGVGLLAGSFFAGAGQQAFDSELRRQGFAGPVRGTVTEASGSRFTVEYADRDGNAQRGYGPVADGTSEPSIGDEVSVLYLLNDPDRIVIIDLGVASDLAGVGNALRIGGIVCLVVGVVLLALGIIGLVRGRKPVPAAGPPPGTFPPGPPPVYQQGAPPPNQPPPNQPPPNQPPPNYPPGPPPQNPSGQYPPGPYPPGPPETGPPGPRPDYLGGPSGPSSPGGPPGQPPR